MPNPVIVGVRGPGRTGGENDSEGVLAEHSEEKKARRVSEGEAGTSSTLVPAFRSFFSIDFRERYFAQQLFTSVLLAAPQAPPSQQSQLPDAQQPASQTQGPPLAQAQPSSTQAQSAQLQLAPQQQAAFAVEEDRAGAANSATRERVTRPTSAKTYFNMT